MLSLKTQKGSDIESSKSTLRIIVVLPAFNEEANLARLLEALDETLAASSPNYRVIVVDDGSSDRTPCALAEYQQKFPITAYRHTQNKGLGATIRNGLYQASRIAGGKDVVITMDADGTHTPRLIPRMVQMIEEGHDIVIASRYQPGSRILGLSLHRRIISFLASVLLRLLFPIPCVRDYTCSFRAYRASILQGAFVRYGDHFVDQEGFQCMAEILIKLRRMPLTFGEVPMILRYDLKKGASKMHLVKTSYKILRLLVKQRLER